MNFNFEFNVGGLVQRLDQSKAVVKSATRAAARAGALVMYEEVRRNVAAKPYSVRGKLLQSIYHAFDEADSLPHGRQAKGYSRATYVVSYNHGIAPHGWLVENGHWRYFRVTRDSSGHWWTMRRPESWNEDGSPKEKPSPPRKKTGNRSAQYAYWQPIPLGNNATLLKKWVPAHPFMRPSWDRTKRTAMRAIQNRMAELLKGKL